MSRFDAFTREEVSTIHFALRMVGKLNMTDGTAESAEALADEAWALNVKRSWQPDGDIGVSERRYETWLETVKDHGP